MRALVLSALALGLVSFAPTLASADDTQEAVNASIRQVQQADAGLRFRYVAPRLIEGRNVAAPAARFSAPAIKSGGRFNSVDQLLNHLHSRSSG